MSIKLTDKASINNLIKEMTLEEKALLLTGKTSFSSYPIERLGIPSILYLDCASGVNLMQYFMEVISRLKDKKAQDEKEGGSPGSLLVMNEDMALTQELTENFLQPEKLSDDAKVYYDYICDNILPGGKLPSAFSDGMSLGASWDPQVVRQAGRAVGAEAAAFGIDILLGSPNVNIHRDPRNGRLFEGLSEDPCLVSKLAPELVKGVQEEDIGADVKHYAANNQETLRVGINEHISERALREIYFPGFKACVQDGKAMTVMSAYNSINGEPCAHNGWLLNKVLKEEWGFEGFVVSDWGAAYDKAKAQAAGNDVDMPGPRDIAPVIKAVKDGELTEDQINDSVSRFLGAIVDLMEMRRTRKKDFDREASRKVAYDMAAQGITLLRNDNDLLPLDKNKSVSFFGEKSKCFLSSGEGSGLVITDQRTSLVDEVKGKIGDGKVFVGEITDQTDVVVVVASLSSSEGWDHKDMELDAPEKEMVIDTLTKAKKAGKQTVFLLNSGGPVETQDFIDMVDAMLWVYYPGMEGGRAAADILYGDVNPSGKLPLTFPKRYLDCPTYGNFPGEFGEVWYGEGIFVGYRYYDTKDIDPLFPFGHGLSYTKFEISGLKLSKNEWRKADGGTLKATVNVKNTGSVAGKEVVQLYISQEKPSIQKPAKELKAFQKVELKPGEQKQVSFDLSLEELQSFDTAYGQWDSAPGVYHVLVGNSSRNITCDETFRLRGHSIYDYSENTPIIELFEDDRVVKVFEKNLRGIMNVKKFEASFSFVPHYPLQFGWQLVAAGRVGENADAVFKNICDDLGRIER